MIKKMTMLWKLRKVHCIIVTRLSFSKSRFGSTTAKFYVREKYRIS